MAVDEFLSRLEKVRRTGNGTWLACCPAHQDKTPSMSVREMDDGRILAYCFAMCGIEEILGAVGLDFDALFPDKPIDHARPLRRPFPAADVLEALAAETRIVAVASSMMGKGWIPPPEEHERLMKAAERIEAGRALANG